MNDDTIYIVSSFHRSGSAMMMRCLEAGGLDVLINREMDIHLNERYTQDGYEPNPNGFYQAPFDILKYNEGFPQFADNFVERARGKAVKIYVEYLPSLPPANYKIIFMRRNPIEIRASIIKMEGSWIGGIEGYNVDNYEAVFSTKTGLLATRNDIEMTILEFRDVVTNPLSEFSKLNIPIDIQSAIAMVEPSLLRFKLENL